MEILDKAIADYKQLKMCEEIAKDEYMPCYILSKLPLGRYYPIDLALAKNPNISSETLDELLEKCSYFSYKKSIEIVRKIVSHEHIASYTLNKIISEYKGEWSILCRIASNPNLLKEGIRKLIDTNNQSIFEIIAERKDLDDEICWALFKCGDLNVLYHLGMNWTCPIEVLEGIVERFRKNEWHMRDMVKLSERLTCRKKGYRYE